MKLEYLSEETLRRKIREVLSQYLDLKEYKAFFFGSRVRGTSFPRADIDIGVDGPTPIPVSIKLKIEEELENLPVLYKIDFVDFGEVSSEFKQLALQHIELI